VIWAVDKYQDILKQKAERETIPGYSGREPKYHYFDTEAEAKSFLRLRAKAECEKVEKLLINARKRVLKCEKKFAFRFSDARGILKPESDADNSLNGPLTLGATSGSDAAEGEQKK
jgi:hypothetical protein